jgi:hypothetical protein
LGGDYAALGGDGRFADLLGVAELIDPAVRHPTQERIFGL